MLEVSRSRLCPTTTAALCAALGGGAWGFAGLYPRFVEGKFRILLGVTAAVFSCALVMGVSTRKTRT